MAYLNPSEDDFRDYFFRDFPYANPDDQNQDLSKVQTQDIDTALSDSEININPALFSSQTSYTTGFLLLAAHFLVLNLRASAQGISGQYAWLQTSKSAGSVSEGLTIPQRILDNPEFAMLSKTNYGAKYLYFVLPLLSGQIYTVEGHTKP